jgi:hypothetical protein
MSNHDAYSFSGEIRSASDGGSAPPSLALPIRSWADPHSGFSGKKAVWAIGEIVLFLSGRSQKTSRKALVKPTVPKGIGLADGEGTMKTSHEPRAIRDL